jgi:hypothetical protein
MFRLWVCNMKRTLLICALILVAALSASFAFAQDDAPVPDPADNLCYEGGAWDDGRCDIPGHDGATSLAWTCGWYMARYYRGDIRADDVIADCQHLIVRGTGEICKVYEDEFGTETICLRANQTGDVRYSECEFACIVFRFIDEYPDEEEDCPVVDGYEPFLPVVTYEDFEGDFTDDELASLGLKPYGCAYIYFD